MKRNLIPILLLIVGILLCTGPLWGILATFSGMAHSFQKASGGGTVAGADVATHVAILVTAAGWIAALFGLATVIAAGLWLASGRNGAP